MADSWMLHPSQGFIRLGGHQLVQAGVAGEAVLKGDDVPGAADEAAARRHIGDVRKLGVGDVQEARQLVTVCGGLIQQDEEFAVRQHEAGCIGTEQFLHILRQPCHETVVFADALPQLVEKVGAVLIAEQQVEFVRKHPGGLALLPVLNHPVEDGVQRDQHSDGHELLPKFPDIIGDDSRFGIHIGGLGKGVEAAGDEELGGKGKPPGLRLRLLQEGMVQILQGGHLALVVVGHVLPVHVVGAAVQDGFLFGRNTSGAHQLFEQGEDELGFLNQRVALIPVCFVHVQGIDVGIGRGRHPDHLAAQRFCQEAEFGFGVQDEDIVIGGQGDADDLLLGGEGFAGAADAQTKAVPVEEFAAVRHDHVLGNSVLPVVDAAALEDLLSAEGNQHRSALCGQGTQSMDLPQAIGQNGIQAIFLLPAQRAHLAQMLSGHSEDGFGIRVQLLLGVGQMHQRHQAEHHPLVSVGEVVQHLLGFLPLLLHVVGQHSGEVVGGVLFPLPVGRIGLHTQQLVLDLPHRLVGGNRQDVDRQHEAAIHVAEFGNHGVFDVGGVILQVEYPAPSLIDAEVVLLKFHGVRAEPILEAVALFHVLSQVEGKGRRLRTLEEIPEQLQPGGGVQFPPYRG